MDEHVDERPVCGGPGPRPHLRHSLNRLHGRLSRHHLPRASASRTASLPPGAVAADPSRAAGCRGRQGPHSGAVAATSPGRQRLPRTPAPPRSAAPTPWPQPPCARVAPPPSARISSATGRRRHIGGPPYATIKAPSLSALPPVRTRHHLPTGVDLAESQRRGRSPRDEGAEARSGVGRVKRARRRG